MNNSAIQVTTTTDQISVVSPYNPEFVKISRNLNGKFDRSASAWKFDPLCEAAVRSALYDIYGYVEGDETLTVRLTARTDISELCSGVSVNGTPIVRAYGRDSGAKVVGDTIMLSGKINSGGSMKNWRTVISEGSVFVVKMNRVSFERLQGSSEWLAEEHSDQATIDRQALIDEKARLVDRIAQIDKQLAN